MKPEEPSKNKLYGHKKSGCDEKGVEWCPRRNNANKKLHTNGTLQEHYEDIMLYFITP